MWQHQIQASIRASKQNYKANGKEKSSSAASWGETATQQADQDGTWKIQNALRADSYGVMWPQSHWYLISKHDWETALLLGERNLSYPLQSSPQLCFIREMASECFSRTGCSTRARVCLCTGLSPAGPEEGEAACSSPKEVCARLWWLGSLPSAHCEGWDHHTAERESLWICVLGFLVQWLGGDWRVRGTQNLCAAAGWPAQATSVELHLSLWGQTERQPTSPLLLHLLLPRLQTVGSSHTWAWTFANLSREELSIASHHERIILGDELGVSSFPLPPPHPPSPSVAAPHICDLLFQSALFCSWNLPHSLCPDISFPLETGK